MENVITTQPEENQGNNNLSDDKVKVNIKPDTDDNKVNINFCSFNCICNFK